ncbi:helix-turn-helix transcriptional regulator [bacterium]|nr:helix-turn-helix transcriptional regulator [bacterium]
MDVKKFYKNLGKRIKVLRENANLTQEQLAEKTGLSIDFIGKIEVNLKHPSIKTLLKFAEVFEISISDLLKDL